MSDRYTDHDRQRHREPAGQRLPPERPFAIDRTRITTSAAFVRLAGITQIDDPQTGPRPHNRQAHSRAVAQLGRWLARRIGADPDLVEAACLAHDLGHPPFGHDGERALVVLTAGSGGFEANAQTLRILTRLAPAAPGTTRTDGLHLTRATLDATCKYPWPHTENARKFGAYPDDLPTLAWIRDGAPTGRRCLEAQIMDAADDIANAVHDLTHGIRTHRIPLTALTDPNDRNALTHLAATDTTSQPLDQVQAAADRLAQLRAVQHLADLDDGPTSKLDTILTALTRQLLRRYIGPIVDATLLHHGDTPLVRHNADLHIPDWAQAELAVLTALNLRYVLRTSTNLRRRAHRTELITQLTLHLLRNAPDLLNPTLHPAWQAATDDSERLRIVIDHVTALTDAQAILLALRRS